MKILNKVFWKKIDWVNTTFLISTPIFAVWLIYAHVVYEGHNPWIWLVFFFFYWATGLSITAGYHRLFSHKTYETGKLTKLFYLLFGAATFQNSALKWSCDHRRHHKHVDSEKDPYNIQKGFFFAHMGWILLKENGEYVNRPFVKDLVRDPLVMWQDKYYILIAALVSFGLPTLIGYFMGSPIGGLAIAGVGRVVLVHHATFFINSFCHIIGRQTYSDKHSARDSVVMAIFTYGEGYHNFHHSFQADYRNGIRWYHYDPTKWVIGLLSLTGLAKKLKRASDKEIFLAKLEMENKRIRQKLALEGRLELPSLDNLKLKVEESMKKWQQLCNEYNQCKRQKIKLSKIKLIEMKTLMKLAKIEMHMNYRQWKVYTKGLIQIPSLA